ncbi:cytochrome c oxidase assembly protein [Devosia pacifica]|uniref:Cytochrome c oxidase assembly protein n=1 Tax=Devosia pacifica TaxID=1335967 RepID=A0A918VY74_9HYPH|nr:cytochrome c oxidase assembly protein [Devosia pacifica]GHA36105.1 cytochrome c oxidase assembly protein [Devosia pacifica]
MEAAFGPLSMHMIQHIVLMNVAVPALLLLLKPQPKREIWRSWPWATTAQLVLLWGWHSPPALSAASQSGLLMLGMHISLIAAAAWFWLAMFTMPATGKWRSILALLITGKLFCLLGALMVFSPRTLFGGMAHAGHSMGASSLADQQLAGLIMLIACPLTYVAIGIVISARWFLALEAEARLHG